MAPTFTIQAAAERTGLSAHVIRAWERRYAAIEPQRSAGQHRLYSEAEIERLALLSRAVRNGHGIGKIARLPLETLRTLATEETPVSRMEPVPTRREEATSFHAEALRATEQFDAPSLEDALRRSLVALGHQGLLQLIIAPLAEQIGERWRTGALTAAHEQFFTAAVKIFVGDLTRQFAGSDNAPRIIVATPTGQLHELGAVLAAATAANLGWRPIYLGPSLPAAEIAGAALSNNATAVAVSIVYPEDDASIGRELSELAALLGPGTRLLTGGRAARLHIELLVRIGALYADNLIEFGQQLDALRRTSKSA